MYTVIKFFTDLQDNNYTYRAGDNYPRFGYLPSPERIAELMGCDNLQGVPLIQLVEDKPKRTRAKKTADK